MTKDASPQRIRTLTVHDTRYIYGCTILIVHFLSIAVFIWRASQNIADPSTFISVAMGSLALLPLTAIYATTFYRFVVATPTVSPDDRTERIDPLPFSVQYFVIILFSFTLIGGIWYLFDHEHLVGGYEKIQTFVSFVEALFAVFLGLTFSRLFPMHWEQPQTAPIVQPPAIHNIGADVSPPSTGV